ncbi:MAG: NifB/NifX family molybdenum-iron cluster-binding protein [Pseudomonadota bacterium]
MTLGWVTYHKIRMGRDPVYAETYKTRYEAMRGDHRANLHQSAYPQHMQIQGQVVAAAGGIPPIKLSDVVTHPNYGQDCLKCHQVIGQKNKAPIDGGTILLTANLTHPFWGTCTVCHKIVDAQGKPVALKSSDPRSMMGVELTESNMTLITGYNLPDKTGPIITKVMDGSLAQEVGLKVGDMFYKVEDRKVENITELERALGAYATGDVARLTLWRGRREILFRFPIPDTATQAAIDTLVKSPFDNGMPVAQIDPNAAIENVPEVTIVAVASNGKELTSPLSTDLAVSPYFIIVDLKKNNFKVMKNAGGTGQQVVHDLMDVGVEAVVCGYVGSGVSTSLSSLGIKVYPGVSGDVQGAISSFQKGQLKEANVVGPQNNPTSAPTLNVRAKRRTL